jgi:hypothetical protein
MSQWLKEVVMSEKDLANIEDVEVDPLTDSDLESASGGAAGGGTNTCPTTSGCPSTSGCPVSPFSPVSGLAKT